MVPIDTASANQEIYIILFQEPPLATYQGNVSDLVATSPMENGKLDVNNTASVAYRRYLETRQAQALEEMVKLVKRPLSPLHQYTIATNGIALSLTADEAAMIANISEVWQILPNTIRYPLTDAGPGWIGTPGIWDGSNTGGLPGTQGEGIIIGVIDTGINMDHPSFAGVGGDGYVYTNPFGSGNYVGFCESDPDNYQCNDKLIGVWGWPEVGNDPEDDYGHGSNVAGIAAGNVVTLTYTAATTVFTPTLSGVAPHANLIAYDVCMLGVSCPDATSIAAIDQAIADGVDVINFSIAGSARDPWSDPLALAFLAAREAGVFVATAAGNSGPNPGTILSPANAPWMTTAGNNSHNARFDNQLLDLSSDATPLADMVGSSITGPYGPAPIVYAADYDNADGRPDDGRCNVNFPLGTWTNGEIVLCDFGGSRSAKVQNVQAGGGGGIVIASNTNWNQRLGIDRFVLPGVNLRMSDADALRTWLASGSGHMATINGTIRTFDDSYGDEVYLTSSRGPTPFAVDVLKPNVTAPGLKIWAAYRTSDPADPPELAFYTGTSMASPHLAGAAALLRDLHPDWTVAEIESALMTTAQTAVLKEDGATAAQPFDRGAGRVDLTVAAQAGLVLDETAVNFLAANPALGGQPEQLNLSSVVNGNCVQTCSWQRTVKNTLAVTATWTTSSTIPLTMTLTVSPTQFTLGPGKAQVITITADAAALAVAAWDFGQVQLRETGGLAPDAHLPVAVMAATSSLPDAVQIDTRYNSSSFLLPDLEATGVTSLTVNTYGPVLPTMTAQSLSQDPSQNDPYDNSGGTFYITRTVPAGAKRLVAEILASTASDLELFVGLDTGDSAPQISEELCRGQTPQWHEYCDLLDPAPGVYWVLVQNVAASVAVTDTVSLVTAVITHTTGGKSVITGPLGTAVSGPFDLRYYWDIPTMQVGDHWYGSFDIGASPANPGDLAHIPINLIRYADAISYTTAPLTVTVGTPATFTMTVQPNVTPLDLTYTIAVTIPNGLSYVAGSASPAATITNNQLNWQVIMPKLGNTPMQISYQAAVNGAGCNQVLMSMLSSSVDNPGNPVVKLDVDTAVTCYQLFLPQVSKP